MKILILVLAILSLFAGGIILYNAESAIHEIEAFVLFTICAVLLCGFGIMVHIDNLGDTVKYKVDYAIQKIKKD